MNKNESKYFNTAFKFNDALLSLLEKKEFSYITIKDVCSEAHVNRSTFYLHYDTTMDLLAEVIENSNKSFIDCFNNLRSPNVYTDSVDDLYLINDDYLIPYLTFIKNNKKIYQAAKNNPKLFGADIYSNNAYNEIISKILDRYNVDEKLKKYIFLFCITGITSVVLKWCENNCDLTIAELADLIKGLILNAKKN